MKRTKKSIVSPDDKFPETIRRTIDFVSDIVLRIHKKRLDKAVIPRLSTTTVNEVNL
jgi:hypothetical protein